MNKKRNDKNAFNSSLGSVSRLKGRWQNYPTGSPTSQTSGKSMTKNEFIKKPMFQPINIINAPPKLNSKSQVSGKSMNMKVKQVQPTPPPINDCCNETADGKLKFTIASLKLECRILNYQNNPKPKDPKERARSIYFRSSIQKRLIAGAILINTLENKCTTQKEIRERTGLSKGIVSKVCNECVEAGWFHLKYTDMNVPCYTTDDTINNSALYYTAKMWEDIDDPLLIEFCRRFDMKYMQNKLDEEGSRCEPET